MRRFAVISAYEHDGIRLPQRKTSLSAGYDLSTCETITLPAHGTAMCPTGLKAYMEPNEVLMIFIRSSIAIKRGIILLNQVGIIDADYVDNPDNEGHIWLPIRNRNDVEVTLQAGERIAQAIFTPFGVTEDDVAEGRRSGGFGSTGQ